MKVAIALVAVAVGYGLFAFDWYGFIEWFGALSVDGQKKFVCVSYFAVGVVVWVCSTVVVPESDDGGRIMYSLLWLPVAVLWPVGFGLYVVNGSLKNIGRNLRK